MERDSALDTEEDREGKGDPEGRPELLEEDVMEGDTVADLDPRELRDTEEELVGPWEEEWVPLGEMLEDTV